MTDNTSQLPIGNICPETQKDGDQSESIIIVTQSVLVGTVQPQLFNTWELYPGYLFGQTKYVFTLLSTHVPT